MENKIGVIDSETDPFIYGRVPQPFTACIYFSEDDNFTLWENPKIKNDIKRMADFVFRLITGIKKMEKCTLLAHNGGKFDYMFLIEYANEGQIIIRNGRIVQMTIGKVTLKDSWPLMPFALAEFNKQKQDYTLHEKENRNIPKNKQIIIDYQRSDCRNLLTLYLGFQKILGTKDTIGSAAFFQIRQMGIKIHALNESHDEIYRDYYFGGRVEAVQKGIFKGPLNYVDMNSAYPDAMRKDHAHGPDYKWSKRLPKNPLLLARCFVHLSAISHGCLPLRKYNSVGTSMGIDFPCSDDATEYFATGWEIIAGLETGTLKIKDILEVWIPNTTINFSPFVDKFYAMKAKAKADKDKIAYLAFKYALNSPYGKLAQNPREFQEYILAEYGETAECKSDHEHSEYCEYQWESDIGALSLWQRSSYHGRGFFDVATAASITGCVRAKLWRGACTAKDLKYMDTDALMCKSVKVDMGPNLGQWTNEGVIKEVAIAGKKVYGIQWMEPDKDGVKEKIVSKGSRLSYKEILDICNGKVVNWQNAAPTFSLTKGAHFIDRNIRRT